MDIVIKLPGTDITENIIRTADWEEGSLFDQVLRSAMKKAVILPKGHWIDKDEKSAVCSCCNRNNLFYGDYCKWCGAIMTENLTEL